MQTDRIQARIETYTSNLTQAVQGGSGAQFSMLLSMIAANQELFELTGVRPSGEGFVLPESDELRYPSPNDFYSQEVTGRLNASVNQSLRGDFAYLNSHIETGALTPINRRKASDAFEKMALIGAGKLMLDEISNAQSLIAHA